MRAHGRAGPIEGGRGAREARVAKRPCCTRGGLMQALLGSIFAQVAEMGVFFIAAAALTAGALALR